MTTPTYPDLNKISPQSENQALTEIHSMLFGTKILQDEPGVVWALHQQKAHPADAQAIDQFMQGLNLEKQVTLARSGGTKIPLSDDQTTMLKQMGVTYDDVQYTQKDAAADTAKQVEQATGGQQTAKLNPDGTIATDKNGNVITVAKGTGASQDTASNVAESSILPGGLLGRIVHDFQNWVVKPIANEVIKPVYRDAIKPIGDFLGKGYNYVSQDIEQQIHNPTANIGSTSLIPNVTNVPPDVAKNMTDLGYDPNSFFSVQAYRASGKSQVGNSGLADKWDAQNPNGLFGWNGDAAVTNAVQFVNDPAGYQKKIENDPTLTPEAVAARLKQLNSPQFQALTRSVIGNSANLGTDAAKNIFHIDPVKHPVAFGLVSAGANLAASFLIDPILLGATAFNTARMTAVGLKTALDSEQAAAHLDPAAQAIRAANLPEVTAAQQTTKAHALAVAQAQAAQGGVINKAFLSPLQRRTQNFIDMAHEMAAADERGDVVARNGLQARIGAQFPEWAPMVPDVLGKNQIIGFNDAGPVLGEGEGIHTLADMANYVASKGALIRLQGGRAAVQSRLTPGAVSGLGLRWFKGKTAQWMTERSTARAENSYAKVISAVEADPERATPFVKQGFLTRIMPEANDAVGLNDQVIATPAHDLSTEGDLTTTYRPALDYVDRDSSLTDGGSFALTPAGKGAVNFAVRYGGKPLGDLEVGFSKPAAIATRARLAAQRLSTLLPRNTLLDTDDLGNTSAEKIFRIGMYYMNRGDANALRSAWNLGDGGQRKAIITGLLDQVGHAAGLGKTVSGQKILDTMKTAGEAYNTAGDEILLDGEKVAQHAGQVRQRWIVPTFRDMQAAATKIGIYEKTFGRVLTSDQIDTLMAQWKLGALFKPSTVTRNQLEAWLRTTLEGKLGRGIQSKAFSTQTNRELWARGFSPETEVEYNRLLQAGEEQRAEKLARSSPLSGEILGRSTPLQRAAEFAPFALAGRAYRQMMGKTMSQDLVDALGTLPKEDLEASMRGYSQQMTEDALGYRNSAGRAQEIANDGLSPMQVKYGPAKLRTSVATAMKKGQAMQAKKSLRETVWTQQDADSTIGADRFANALNQRINATPSVAKAAIDILEDPENYNIAHLVAAMDDPSIATKMHRISYGNIWSPNNDVNFVRTTDPAEQAEGKIQFATKVLNDYRALFTGQDGNLSTKLTGYIKDFGAPDSTWIRDNLKNAERPHGVLAPETMAASPQGNDARSVINTLQDLEGGAYQWLVERPLQRTTSSPVFLANYAEARLGLNSAVENMVSQGVSREAANELAKEAAIKNAWVRTETMIDDPGQKSQFDIVARNFFPFSRATTAMIRRWGGGIYRDPAQARQMQLAYEGAQHAGLVFNNQYGEPTYVYPGSGAMNMLLRGLSEIPGLQNLARFPISASMTGGVLMSVPGADNPLRLSAGPMIMIPLRELSNFLPGDDKVVFNEVDSAINGPIGVGQTFGALKPAIFRKFYDNMNTDQRNSVMASSTIGALANLAAAGMIPAKDADNATMEQFRRNVQAQVRTQLFIRAVFGLVAPAAPSQPTEAIGNSTGSDYTFQLRGIKQLSDEYKTILNDVNGNVARASAIWAGIHPEQMVYTQPASQATTSKVSLPSTDSALAWMLDNQSFIKKYGNVSAYFLPEPTGNEPFSDQAYRAQIELGLRQKKTPDEFMQNIYIRNAEATFYPTVEAVNARIQQAKIAGDTQTEKQLTDAKSQWETQFKQQNPLFGNKLDSYPDARALARAQLGNLREMVKTHEVPDGQEKLLSNMIQTYDNYEAFLQKFPGQTDADRATKHEALQQFDSWAMQNVKGTPLVDLYNGVFRTLDTNLQDLSKLPGGTQ